MWIKFSKRFLVTALILVFTLTLSVPAFAAGEFYPMPGYVFAVSETFAESSFVKDGSNYKIPAFTPSYKMDKADSCVVSFCGQNIELEWFGYSSNQFSMLYCIGNASLIDDTMPDTGHGFFLALYQGNKENSFFVCSADFYRDYIQGTGDAGFTISVSVPDTDGLSFLTKMFSAFSDVGEWLRDQIGVLIRLFWDSATNQLTFAGVLSLISLGFGVVLLLIKVILNFLHFRS